MEIPQTRYAKAADGMHIAYQVLGDGPIDLLFVPGFVSNLELNWELPAYAKLLTRLASFTRLMILDRRGTGLSDPLRSEDHPSHETMIDDLRAVMDAADSPRAAFFGFHEGGVLSSLFAASQPARTSALITYGTAAAGTKTSDFPWQWTAEEWGPYLDEMAERWGTGPYAEAILRWVAPDAYQDERTRSWWAKYCRMAASPGSAVTLERIYSETDICSVLPSIHVPTLILHGTLDDHEEVDGARYLAAHIPNARLVETSGQDSYPWGDDQDAVVAEVEEFLTGVRPVPGLDRELATVMFTDIVGSTERLTELGDAEWRSVLARHDERVRVEIERHRGRLVDSAGDGVFATFDGPARAVRCAQAIGASVRELGIQIRAGVHTGEVEREGDAVRGIAVHIGARVAALGGPSEVLVSQTVKDLTAGSGLVFEDRGEHELKGVPERWHLYAVASRP